MVRNLTNVKVAPSRPTRSWRYKAGPRESTFTATHTMPHKANHNGNVMIASATSSTALHSRILRTLHGTRDLPTTDDVHERDASGVFFIDLREGPDRLTRNRGRRHVPRHLLTQDSSQVQHDRAPIDEGYVSDVPCRIDNGKHLGIRTLGDVVRKHLLAGDHHHRLTPRTPACDESMHDRQDKPHNSNGDEPLV